METPRITIRAASKRALNRSVYSFSKALKKEKSTRRRSAREPLKDGLSGSSNEP